MHAGSCVLWKVTALLGALGLTAWVVDLAFRHRTPPVRCPDGMVLSAGHCCGVGQTHSRSGCVGTARSCASGQQVVTQNGTDASCVLAPRRIELGGGILPQGIADWQRPSLVDPVRVPAFAIDQGEVTLLRYLDCVSSGVCRPSDHRGDLGAPVAGISPADAERFCRFAGGRLPSSAEWQLAAAGTQGRRFPWGHHGLVCRRAAFGLVDGPCSTGATGPELAGSRPAGATPDGILDLAGNVAEWTRDPDGRYRARGGSYLSRFARELVTAAVEAPRLSIEHVGFRCVY